MTTKKFLAMDTEEAGVHLQIVDGEKMLIISQTEDEDGSFPDDVEVKLDNEQIKRMIKALTDML